MSVTGQRSRIRTAFAQDGLLVVDQSAVRDLDVSVSEREFLTSVGLPRMELFGFTFDVGRTLPTIESLLVVRGETAALSQRAQQRRCIAENFRILLVLDLSEAGAVSWVDLDGELPEMFLNSTVECLVGCLAECITLSQNRDVGLDPRKFSQDLREGLRQIDPPAVEHLDGWWGTVLEEAANGLL